MRRSKSGRPARDEAIIARLVEWFARSARDLPWRRADPETGRRDAYHALVAETMLQQTQVARVAPKFEAFIERFPSVEALAEADEQDVLAAWSGLGYYRRARLLRRAARAIAEDHGARTPADPDALAALPGVGRYTAGAIASIVFNRPAPIVDGNVARVLLRLEGRDAVSGERETQAWAWERSGVLAERAGERVGVLNEALMELGATVCTPQAPRCLVCPLAERCEARRTGRQESIPRPKAPPRRRDLHLACAVLRDERGRLLVDRRSTEGLWGGMWQPPTIEGASAPADAEAVSAALEIGQPLAPAESFTHLTTHRAVRFAVFRSVRPVRRAGVRRLASGAGGGGRRWLPSERIEALALSNPHRRILLGS